MGFMKFGTPEKIEVVEQATLAVVLQKFGVTDSDEETTTNGEDESVDGESL